MSDTAEKLSPREVSLMRHALGIRGKAPGERNWFSVSLDSEDDVTWAGLVTKGMARVMREPGLWWPLRVYGVTDQGKQMTGEETTCPK